MPGWCKDCHKSFESCICVKEAPLSDQEQFLAMLQKHGVTPRMRDTEEGYRAFELDNIDHPKLVEGFTGPYVEFTFDKDGNLLSIGIWG